jgi:hypothetical protein
MKNEMEHKNFRAIDTNRDLPKAFGIIRNSIWQ